MPDRFIIDRISIHVYIYMFFLLIKFAKHDRKLQRGLEPLIS